MPAVERMCPPSQELRDLNVRIRKLGKKCRQQAEVRQVCVRQGIARALPNTAKLYVAVLTTTDAIGPEERVGRTGIVIQKNWPAVVEGDDRASLGNRTANDTKQRLSLSLCNSGWVRKQREARHSLLETTVRRRLENELESSRSVEGEVPKRLPSSHILRGQLTMFRRSA